MLTTASSVLATTSMFQHEPNNIELRFGKSPAQSITYCFVEDYTLLRRFKWWLFCKIFPFEIVKFTERKDNLCI